MAQLDESKRTLLLKLVYYGPALSGKTTNLVRLHDLLSSSHRGPVMSLDTHGDRTLFFDLLPIGFRAPSGLLMKPKLFTVPGQVQHDSTRKAVLSRADGVVFVADSQRTQGVNNAEAFQNLAENAARVGLGFEQLPMVVQFNKRDLPNIYSEEEVHERWQNVPWPLFFASALSGNGVRETFAALLRAVYPPLDAAHALSSAHGVRLDDLLSMASGAACVSGGKAC